MNIIADDYILTAYGDLPVDKASPEDQGRMELNSAIENFKKIINKTHDITHNDILDKMHEVQNNPEYTLEFRKEIYQAYDCYMTVRKDYAGHLEGLDLGQMKAEVRAIDPDLLKGEERYKETEWAVKKFVLDIFYTIKRFFTSDATLARYAGRIQFLGEEFLRSDATQRVMELFPKYIAAAPEIDLDTVQKIDEFLTYMEFVSKHSEDDTFPRRFKQAKERLIAELKDTVHPNLAIVFDRAIEKPQEPYFSPLTSENIAALSTLPETLLKTPVLTLSELSEEDDNTSSTSSSGYKYFNEEKESVEGIEQAKQEIALNPLAWEGPDIIGEPQSIEDYVNEHFGKTQTPRKKKSAARALHFRENGYSMRIARGDGNCFTNSLAGGLMDVVKKNPGYRKTLIKKLREFQRCKDPYVLSQAFTKNEDFKKLIEDLEQGKKDLDNHTMAAFSRVLRYVLSLEKFENVIVDRVDRKVGELIDFSGIFAFNKAFELNARVLILEAAPSSGGKLNPYDPESSSYIFRTSGTLNDDDDPETKMGLVEITDFLKKEPDESFNIMRVDGHFNLMVKTCLIQEIP